MSMKIHQIHKFIGIKTEVKSQLPIHIGMLNHLWKVSMWILPWHVWSEEVKLTHDWSWSWTGGWLGIDLTIVWRWRKVDLVQNGVTSTNTQCGHYKQMTSYRFQRLILGHGPQFFPLLALLWYHSRRTYWWKPI